MAIGSISLQSFSSGSSLWKRYNASLKYKPLQTKALTCATAYAIGDLAAQLSGSKCRRLRDKVGGIDVVRTGRMAMFGAMWTGCVGHYFYTNLDKVRALRMRRRCTPLLIGPRTLAFAKLLHLRLQGCRFGMMRRLGTLIALGLPVQVHDLSCQDLLCCAKHCSQLVLLPTGVFAGSHAPCCRDCQQGGH